MKILLKLISRLRAKLYSIDVERAPPEPSERSFMTLRITYLLVTLVIMLADGLQGKFVPSWVSRAARAVLLSCLLWRRHLLRHLRLIGHACICLFAITDLRIAFANTGTHLYVLYESYGFSVASLYCLGFATGGIMSPITGPLVDKIGRKKSAILYCLLEIFINMLEQYPFLTGLIVSRMIGGFTTNLLSSVFETWLDTEYRRRGFQKEKYEIIMRDSVIVSNMAAICSGYLAHILADPIWCRRTLRRCSFLHCCCLGSGMLCVDRKLRYS